MPLPTRDELREDLARLDETQQKLVGGVLAIMFERPAQVRDREWIVEQFTQVTLLAAESGGLGPALEEVEHAHEGAEVVQRYVQDNVDVVLNACFALFVHVAEDVQGQDDPTAADAMLQALTYFAPPED